MICNIKNGQNEKLIVKKGFSVMFKQAFHIDHFFFENNIFKLLWVKSKLFSRVVFLKPHIARPCVALHSFHPRDARCFQSNRSVGLRCEFLPSELLHELLDREASSVPRNSSSGKDMVWPSCLVSM